MVIPRRYLMSEHKVSLIHVVSRVVRKSWLLGTDPKTGKNYNHRKVWFKNRLRFLAQQFSIEVCGYAILSNHSHILVRNRPDLTGSWSAEEVARRWWQLFPRRLDNSGAPAEPTEEELELVLLDPKTGIPRGRLDLLRTRLASISWFMRCLNEYIARKSNREDECTGRFWEGRFKSTELLDQSAVLSCLAYVDLNPIHAGMAKTPEESDFTSAQDRIVARMARKKLEVLRETFHQSNKVEDSRELKQMKAELIRESKRDIWLSPLYEIPLDKNSDGYGYGSFLNMKEEDYLTLLDWTGKQMRPDKPGSIPANLQPLLTRMDIEMDAWLETVKKFDNWFHRVAGRLENITEAAKNHGKKWLVGKTGAKTAFR